MAVDIESPGILGARLENAIKALILPLIKSEVGLNNVDNTSDLDKPVSIAAQIIFDAISETLENLATQLSEKLDTVEAENYLNKFNNLSDLQNKDTARINLGLGTSAVMPVEAFATASQGTLAENAVQLESLALVATTGNYSDLTNKPTLGTAASQNITAFATAAQGVKADNAIASSEKGVANGVAPLGSDNKVPSIFLPVDGSFLGTWNADTNTPTITSGSGIQNSFYIVSVSGSTTIDGINTWSVGDQIRFNGTNWSRIPSVQAVNSVNGKLGNVVLNANDISGISIVGKTGSYTDLINKPTLGTAAAQNSDYFRDASNMATGTFNKDRLPSSMNSTNFVGTVTAEEFYGNLSANYLTGTIDNSRLPNNITITGNYGGATVRITAANNPSLASTSHGLQIGSTSSYNVAFGYGSIIARNNGASSPLGINILGRVLLGDVPGNVYIGNSTNNPVSAHYPGTSATNNDYPVGSLIFASQGIGMGNTINLNAVGYVIRGSNAAFGVQSTDPGSTKLPGTWRSRGSVALSSPAITLYVMQRVA